MRIGLILPRGVFVAQNTWMADFMDHHPESFRPWMIPSCGLLTIAALTPVDAEFDYVDEQVEDVDFDQPYDIVALSGMTQQASRAYAIAREFRRRGVYTVMGGAHWPERRSGGTATILWRASTCWARQPHATISWASVSSPTEEDTR